MRDVEIVVGICTSLFLLPLLPPAEALAAWPTDPTVNIRVCPTASNQYWPRIVSDGNGGAIITWEDYRGSGGRDLYAQHLSATGEALWPAGGVALCTATGDQVTSEVIADGAGGAIVVWADERLGYGNADIYAQRISADGVVRWTANGVAVCTAAGEQRHPVPIPDGTGGVIVLWNDRRTASAAIYGQRISAAGATQWTTNGKRFANLLYGFGAIPDGAGGAVVAWDEARVTSEPDIYSMRISGSGTALWAAPLCLATGMQTVNGIVADGAGGAIVVWYDTRFGVPPTMEGDSYAQRVSGDGTALWVADGVPVCAASGNQSAAAVIPDGAGGAIVLWGQVREDAGIDIHGQRTSNDGVSQWPADGLLLRSAPGNRGGLRAFPDGTGGVMVFWADVRGSTRDLYAQRFSLDGAALWAAQDVPFCTAAGSQEEPPVLAGDMAGGVIGAWSECQRTSPRYYQVYAQNISLDGVLGGELPTPVLAWLVSAEAKCDRVELTWSAPGLRGAATIQRRLPGADWTPIAELYADGMGYLRHTDRVEAPGTRVGYRLRVVDAGLERHLGEAWVDMPGSGFALHGAFPNPADGRSLSIRFSLAGGEPARLQLLDATGRCVTEREVGSWGPGPHVLDLSEGRPLPPGLYLVRLTQGPDVRVARVAVLR